MSETETVEEVKASDSDSEAFKPLIDFLSKSIYDSFEATKDVLPSIMRKVMINDKITEHEKRALFLELGALFSLNELVQDLHREGLDNRFFTSGARVKWYLEIMSKAAEALEELEKLSSSSENIIATAGVFDKLRNTELELMSLIKAVLKHSRSS
jgi:hypothetical protein